MLSVHLNVFFCWLSELLSVRFIGLCLRNESFRAAVGFSAAKAVESSKISLQMIRGSRSLDQACA
jgi:hypothetical protein